MAEGNRKDPRARVLNMTVRYKSATVDEFIENHSHDISRGGIFIKTRSPFPAGTLLKFEVRIAEDQKLMHGVGRVVWRREPERAEESFPAGMGIKFIKTGEGATELINQLVAARNGAESSFDAGVRESGTRTSAAPPAGPGAISGLSAAITSAAPIHVPVIEAPSSESSPALFVESGPHSAPVEAETQVSSPPKKRRDQEPEKRKVVLQGPALDAPPSSTRPVAAASGSVAEQQAPSRDLSTAPRNTTFDETTSPRARPTKAKKDTTSSPSVFGLFVILGVIGLGVFLIKSWEDAPEPPAAVAPEPTPAAPTPTVVAAQPEPVAPAAANEPEPALAEEGALAVPASATASATSGANASPAPAPPNATAKPAPVPTAQPAPAAAKPAAAPLAAPPKAPLPVVPKPRAVAPVAKPRPAPAPPRETPPSPPPAAAPREPTIADAEKKPSEPTPAPEQKKPAPPTVEAAPKAAPKPAPPPPAATPAPTAPVSDDNPY